MIKFWEKKLKKNNLKIKKNFLNFTIFAIKLIHIKKY